MVWRQFRRKKLAMMGLCVIVFLAGVAVLAPVLANDVPIFMVMKGKTYWLPYWVSYPELVNFDFKYWEPGEGEQAVRPIVPYSPLAQWLDQNQDPPSRKHWLGMDDRGRDVLARMIWGTRISMSIGLVAVGIAVTIGIALGSLAGYYGGWVDIVLQRVIEVMMCFPTFFLILAVIAFLRPNIWTIMVVLGLMGWTGIARLVRGEFMKLRGSEFALAAHASGLSDFRIMFRHLLPNALAPVLVSATFGVAGAILTESGLSFLGFGVQPPTASWGDLLKQANELVSYGIWWLVVFPGAAVFVTVTAFNLVGEGLRDAMDPRLRA